MRSRRELDGVDARHLDQKGRGRALRAAWSASTSRVVAYMDVDLSTDLDALLPLVAPLLSGHSDVAIGTRLASGARVVRGPKRELISRGYNLILKTTLRAGFSDAQCGFKAVRADVARSLLPLVEDQGWFFDTELLVLAEHNGLRIHEVPVDWVDDPVSRVDIVSTATADLKGVWRMVRRFARGDGEIEPPPGTPAVDPGLGHQARAVRVDRRGQHRGVRGLVRPARRSTRPPRRERGGTARVRVRQHRREPPPHVRAPRSPRTCAPLRRGTTLGMLPLALTLTVLAMLSVLGVTSLSVMLVALTLANLTATGAKFLLLRNWVFRP